MIDPPTTGVSLDKSGPTPTETVTATATPVTNSGQPVTLTYIWSINNNVVQSRTKTDTTDSLDLSQFPGVAVGAQVRVTVTPNVDLSIGSSAIARRT